MKNFSGVSRQVGVLAYILAIFLLAVMDSAVKWLGASYPVGEMVLFRSFFGFIPLSVLYIIEQKRSGKVQMMPKRPFLQIVRGIVVTLIIITFFWSLKGLALANATAISLVGPILMVCLGVLFLGERAGIGRWVAVLIGFGGVLLIIQPTQQSLSMAALAALASAFFYALAAIITRRLSVTDSSFTTSLWSNVILISIALGMTFATNWITPNGFDLMILCIVGIAGGASNILFVIAFKLAEVSLVAALDYTVFFWAVIFGASIFGEFPTLVVWTGAGIVILSGLYIAKTAKP